MGFILGRAGLLSAVLMLGFILGIIYQDHGGNLGSIRFEEKESEVATSGPGFILKEEADNKIIMEDSDGLVIYDENEMVTNFHGEGTHYVEKTETVIGRNESGIFSRLGTLTAEVFEKGFGTLLSNLN